LARLLLARLEDPGVAEVMLNPDGRVWVDRFDGGLIEADLC
jgi:Flp pilus assembly CpaF family ATPase